MNIYAVAGYKVRCINTDQTIANFGGCDRAEGVLEIGKVYTIDHIDIHSWHTKVYLKEVEGEFNSAHFEDLEEER